MNVLSNRWEIGIRCPWKGRIRVQTDGFDHQGIAFPPADGCTAIGGFGILAQRTAVDGNASQQSVSVGNGEPLWHQQELDVIGRPTIASAVKTGWNTVRPPNAAIRAGYTRRLDDAPGFRLIHVQILKQRKQATAGRYNGRRSLRLSPYGIDDEMRFLSWKQYLELS